jgi:hypothetical protein
MDIMHARGVCLGACLAVMAGCSTGGSFQGFDVQLDLPPGDAIDGVTDGLGDVPVDGTDVPVDLPEDCADSDGDGVCDSVDACPGHDDTADEDGDTVPDGCDLCPGGDDREDEDDDGIPDDCDCDGSGIVCDENATCYNTETGPTCVCNDGWEGDGFTCTDIDECALGTDTCDVNATCTNTPGSYTCACNAGYDGDGYTCTDIDECALGTDTCDVNATCTNTDGGYDCTCNTGYSGDGFSCTPINHCSAGTDTCDTNASCIYTGPGTYDCVCHTGYTGDGFTCTPIDHCSAGTHTCDTHATCTYTGPGTYSCTCNSGYTGDGHACTPIDHCAAGTHTCDVHATCTYTGPGTYSCTCNSGYTGDGYTCTPISTTTGGGHAVMIGHDYFASNASADTIVGNAVLLADTTGTINVLGYTQYSDTSSTGEVSNTNSAITTRAAAVGRSVSFSTPLTDYTLLSSRLPGNHVLLIYEMEMGGSGSTIGAAWASTLTSFVNSGGVVIACAFLDQSWQVMDSAGLLAITSSSSAYSSSISVVDSTDPIAASVASPYTGPNGSAQFVTSETGIVTQVPGGNPVVIHREFASSGCLDGTSEVIWSDEYHACGGPTQSWQAYSEQQHLYCAPGWVMANETVVNDELTGPGYTTDVKYAFNGDTCTESQGWYFATRYDSYSQPRSACGWASSHHWSVGSNPSTGMVDGIVCQRVPGTQDLRYTGTAGPSIGTDWILCGRVTATTQNPLLTSVTRACLVRGLREWAVARATGVCETGNQDGWEYPNDNASRTYDSYLDSWTSSGWISPSYSGSNTCGIWSLTTWSTSTAVRTYGTSESELFIYYHR